MMSLIIAYLMLLLILFPIFYSLILIGINGLVDYFHKIN